jgi:hypothetical protein
MTMTTAKKETKAKAEVSETRNLVQKLADVMKTITPMHRSEQAGQGGYSYKFVSVNAMLDDARPKLAEAGILFYGSVQDYERIEGTTGRGGNRTTIYLTVRWFLRDGDEEFSFVTIGEAMDTGDKATNKAFTASQKQAISKLLMMSGTDDDPDRMVYEENIPIRQPAVEPRNLTVESLKKEVMDILQQREQNPGSWGSLVSSLIPRLANKKSSEYKDSDWQDIHYELTKND